MRGIEVFQNLALTGPADERAAIAAALKQSVASPWLFDEEGSTAAERNALGDTGILIFQREPRCSVKRAPDCGGGSTRRWSGSIRRSPL
jgi:hypothetical protein